MVGTTQFALDEPDQGADPTSPVATAVEAVPREPGAQQQASDVAGPVPAPPRLPYSPSPGTYTQLWLSETAGIGAAEMASDWETYMWAFSGNPC
jgi:hypothetical protein